MGKIKYSWIIILLSNYVSYAQIDDCSEKVRYAVTVYESGKHEEAKDSLKSALKNCNLSKADKITANKQLIIYYKDADEDVAANNIAWRLIKMDPNYKPGKSDDPRLVKIFEKIKSIPIFTVGFGIGGNMSFPSVVNAYSVAFPDGGAPSTYNGKIGFQFQLAAERQIFNTFWVQLALQYRESSYEHILYNVDSNTINYREKLNYVDIPLSAKYYFGNKTVTPYLFAGVDMSFLTKALSTTSRPGEKSIINRTNMRNSFSAGYFGGAGLKYRVKSFNFFADARYIFFPSLVNKAGTRFSDPINLFQYYYIDDDFRLNSLQFTVGVSYILKYRFLGNEVK